MILTLFLFICHFLIITILITVLTNSFMSVVQNANEEHQFVFAVNTISMVKSDALFSYVAPTNVIAWLLAPLRFAIPFRQFVGINRTVIKATHFPILFSIYAYERLILRRASFDRTDLIDDRGRTSPNFNLFKAATGSKNLLSPRATRIREPSVATQHKDRALEEVFRRFGQRDTMLGSRRGNNGRSTSNVVNHWMSNLGPNDIVNPPMEQDQSIVDRLESRQLVNQKSQIGLHRTRLEGDRDFTTGSISIVSDPEEIGARNASQTVKRRLNSRLLNRPRPPILGEGLTQSDADGDDELITNDEEDIKSFGEPGRGALHVPQDHAVMIPKLPRSGYNEPKARLQSNIAKTPRPQLTRFGSSIRSSSDQGYSGHLQATSSLRRRTPPSNEKRHHSRMPSTTTIIYDPPPRKVSSTTSSPGRRVVRKSGANTGSTTPNRLSSGRRTPKRVNREVARPILPPRTAFQSTPNLFGMLAMASQPRRDRRSSLTAFEIGSDLGDNKAVGGGFVGAAPIPASFATQMAYAKAGMRARKAAQKQDVAEDVDRMSRLVLTRINTLEEGFKDVIKEVQELRKGTGGRPLSSVSMVKPVKGGNGKKMSQTTSEKENEEPEEFTFEMDRNNGHGESLI